MHRRRHRHRVLGDRVRTGRRWRAWDAPAYWSLAYPGALLVSAVLGVAMPARAWLWGPIVVFAQVPVVIAVSGAGPLLLAGLLYAAVLSIPAALVSASAAWARGRMRRTTRR